MMNKTIKPIQFIVQHSSISVSYSSAFALSDGPSDFSAESL